MYGPLEAWTWRPGILPCVPALQNFQHYLNAHLVQPGLFYPLRDCAARLASFVIVCGYLQHLSDCSVSLAYAKWNQSR
jgi:hypothetical protein